MLALSNLAIENALLLSQTMLSWINEAINKHLERLSCGIEEELTAYSLAIKGAEAFKVNHAEFVQQIVLYVRHRPELEILSNREKTIRLVPEVRERELMSPQACALRYYAKICEAAPALIERLFSELEPGQNRIKIQDLGDKLASELQVKPYVAYFCFRQYIKEKRPDLKVFRGREGGLGLNV